MENVYKILRDFTGQETGICLATIVATSGSVPQVSGSSALFSERGLLTGTLGGGVMEGEAGKRAREAILTGKHLLYDFMLNADINDREGALCGGNATILIDPKPGMHMDRFREMCASLEQGRPGLMITVAGNKAEIPIRRYWLENGRPDPEKLPDDLIFIEPLFPVSKLYIAGAGHIGRALAHMARLLDFEVTVIDDRPEYANSVNIPDASHVIVKPIGEAVSEIPESKETYIVIVTRGHQDDAEALKACIRHDLPYIGMIGSRRKIRTMKEKFIKEGWSTSEEFERVRAPVGIEIGSVTVQEIALSISAQLVQVRAAVRMGKKREIIAAVILAAGESRRMGQPKMLLPFRNSTMIGTVISNAGNSICDHIRVVLGADSKEIEENIAELMMPQQKIKIPQQEKKKQKVGKMPQRMEKEQQVGKMPQRVEKVLNRDYRSGMLSSVQEGLRSLPEATTAVMILLGDQPMVTAEIMDKLIERYKQSEKEIIIASTDGKKGHPMIFSAQYIPEILAYGPGNSLRDLPGNHPGEVEEMETGNPAILRDIDTPEDYENEKSII